MHAFGLPGYSLARLAVNESDWSSSSLCFSAGVFLSVQVCDDTIRIDVREMQGKQNIHNGRRKRSSGV